MPVGDRPPVAGFTPGMYVTLHEGGAIEKKFAEEAKDVPGTNKIECCLRCLCTYMAAITASKGPFALTVRLLYVHSM